MVILTTRDIEVIATSTLAIILIKRFIVTPATIKLLIGNEKQLNDSGWLLRDYIVSDVANLLDHYNISVLMNNNLPRMNVALALGIRKKRIILTNYPRNYFSRDAESFVIAHEIGHFANNHFRAIYDAAHVFASWMTIFLAAVISAQFVLPVVTKTATPWPTLFWVFAWIAVQVPLILGLLLRELQADRFAIRLTNKQAADEVFQYLDRLYRRRPFTRFLIRMRHVFCVPDGFRSELMG